MLHYTPLSVASYCFDTSRKNLQNLFYKDKKEGRSDRFIKDDEGNLLVHPNYKCPHFDLISELYYKALEVAGCEKDIARFIAKRTGKNEACVYLYLRNFKFKNPDFAKIVAKLLKIYIKQNSLFADEILGSQSECF